jgi:hypothetical protein
MLEKQTPEEARSYSVQAPQPSSLIHGSRIGYEAHQPSDQALGTAVLPELITSIRTPSREEKHGPQSTDYVNVDLLRRRDPQPTLDGDPIPVPIRESARLAVAVAGRFFAISNFTSCLSPLETEMTFRVRKQFRKASFKRSSNET